jgi:hypothetical protein
VLHFATSGEEALDHLAGHIQRQRQSEMPLAFGIGLNCGPAWSAISAATKACGGDLDSGFGPEAGCRLQGASDAPASVS